MEIWQATILLLSLMIAKAFADLQNPGFESPPTNIPKNSINTFASLNSTINTIPGWSYQGTVKYVTSTSPGEHAIYLGQNGKINQTFKSNQESNHYLLTFNLQPAQSNCSNPTSVVISGPDRAVRIFYQQKFGNDTWETHACYLGSHGNGDLINLFIENQTTDQSMDGDDDLGGNTTVITNCGVVLDSFILKNIVNPIKNSESNFLLNGGFEYGPAFPNNSFGGILIDAESSPTQSTLNQWAILGTVKYISSNKNYIVPEGNAAIEIVSGESSGLQTAVTLKKGTKYDLELVIADANDSCIGDFMVGVQAGSTGKNFTLQSKGIGSSEEFTLTFVADSSVTPISILSFTTTQTKDLVFCGPVIDKVVLLASYGLKLRIKVLFVGLGFLVTLTQFIG
ncbi:uncharacterized protein LOC113277402 [Papaver somniferum]|uniref:uncharacterized protein LOC113277402 n=1 Tax=Papaver somniferum TaxID=3469 RepID=UPI000E6FA6D3|nr:uncharacterized protein LOC113277402 [Papaver somniferum]